MKKEKFEFDYTPTMVYTQDKSCGIGKLYFNGIQAKGLIDFQLSAHTRDEKTYFSTLKLEVAPEIFANSLTGGESELDR